VLYLQLIIFSLGDDVPIDSEMFLMIDFMNLKIKSIQSFKRAHRDKIYIYIFIGVNTHIYIYIYTIFIIESSQRDMQHAVADV
jgi:hypothetical protein